MATNSQYARRRMIALLAIVVIAAGLYFLLRFVLKPGDEPATSPSPSPTVSVTPSVEPSPSPSPTVSAAPGACPPESLEVGVVADGDTYIIGQQQVTFQVSIKNIGQTLCLTDGGTAGVTLAVFSGEERIWSSADCQANASNRPLLMEPGISDDKYQAVWTLNRSQDGCPADLPGVTAGTYTAIATVGGTSSAGTIFTLQDPPQPTTEAPAEPPAEPAAG